MLIVIPVSVKQTLLFCEPLPCNPAAETALQPPIWCCSSQYSQGLSYPEECFFSQTPVCVKLDFATGQTLANRAHDGNNDASSVGAQVAEL